MFKWLSRGKKSEEPQPITGSVASAPLEYPWYAVVEGDAIKQGDILESCPVFLPPENLATTYKDTEPKTSVKWIELDLIVMSQSCDLAKGREKVDDVFGVRAVEV